MNLIRIYTYEDLLKVYNEYKIKNRQYMRMSLINCVFQYNKKSLDRV